MLTQSATHLVQQIQLLDTDRINLVQYVDRRDIDPVSLHHVNDLVDGAVGLVYRDGGIVHPVFAEHGADFVGIDFGQRYSVGYGELTATRNQLFLCRTPKRRSAHASLLPLLHSDFRPVLVKPDPETVQLFLQDRQVVQGFEHVQYDKDEVAGSGDCSSSKCRVNCYSIGCRGSVTTTYQR